MFVHFGRHLHYLRYSDLNLFPTGAFQLLILDKSQNLVSLRSTSHQQFHLAIKRRSIVGIVSFSLRICLLIVSVSERNLSVKKWNTANEKTTVMSSVCVLHPVFAFCVLWYVRRQNARRSPKCLEILGAMLGTGQENVIGRGRKHTVC